jgi:hypothetical protein
VVPILNATASCQLFVNFILFFKTVNTDNQKRGISRAKKWCSRPFRDINSRGQLGKLVLVDNVLAFAFSFSFEVGKKYI